jgi:hypothetical protein
VVKPPGGKPGGNPGPANGPVAYLKLSPPTASAAVGQVGTTSTAVFSHILYRWVDYQVEGYDADGHDLGDFTDKAHFEMTPDGKCVGASCSPSVDGGHEVTATVPGAEGTASLSGVPPSMACRGENYDVNGSFYDGCEQHQAFQGHTDWRDAQWLGATTCTDGLSQNSFSGALLSDGRSHADPGVPNFDHTVGSAPAWRKVLALGGSCVNDYKITVQMTGGGSTKCYRLAMRVAGDPATHGDGFYATYHMYVAGNETKTISGGASSYDDLSTVYFEIEKTCPASVREKVSYTVSYHL